MRTRSRPGPLVRLAVLSALAGGCADPNEPPPTGAAEVGVHPPGWTDAASPSFHGTFLAADGFDTAECRSCHGSDYLGGLVDVSCKDCHDRPGHPSFPHPEGWAEPGPTFHGDYLRSSRWDLAACRTCHGEDYGTVKLDQSCLTCHTAPDGPESCNTCHGNPAADPPDLTQVAPPEGLNGETDPTSRAVGAHQHHLTVNPSRPAAATCAECHQVPTAFGDATHVDASPGAEIVFGGALGSLPTEGGTRVPVPSYDAGTGTCSSTYCHGNWALREVDSQYSTYYYFEPTIRGNSATPVWTDASTGDCGTCHDLPPAGHRPEPLTECAGCHEGVIDATGTIIDPSKHVNGQVNVFNEEYPMF